MLLFTFVRAFFGEQKHQGGPGSIEYLPRPNSPFQKPTTTLSKPPFTNFSTLQFEWPSVWPSVSKIASTKPEGTTNSPWTIDSAPTCARLWGASDPLTAPIFHQCKSDSLGQSATSSHPHSTSLLLFNAYDS